jgi:hypothetical protein
LFLQERRPGLIHPPCPATLFSSVRQSEGRLLERQAAEREPAIPTLNATLVRMRGAARMAGLGGLRQFLERGFSAFKRRQRPRDFVAVISARERAIMERGHPAPFGLAE